MNDEELQKLVLGNIIRTQEAIMEMERETYNKFMIQYNLSHAACPKCGSAPYSSTLVGYIFNSRHPDKYKDLNECMCLNCGDKHIYHERIPEHEADE